MAEVITSVLPGEPIVVDLDTKGRIGEHNIACCDCGLVHQVRFTVRDGHVVVQAWRDAALTRRQRRALGKKAKERKR